MKASNITWLIATIIIAGAIIVAVMIKNKEAISVSKNTVGSIDPKDIVFGEVIELERQNPDHVLSSDEYETHNSNPPTSGAHLSQAPTWGVYKKESNDLSMIHALEHGGIWISYQPDLNEDMVKDLKAVARQNPGSTIMAPRAANSTPIAIASWGRLMYLETPNVAKIQSFIDSYKNDTHEPLAR